MKFCIIHDYGTNSFLKEEFYKEKEAESVLEKWKKDIYAEYGEETDNNYVWVKAYDLSDPDDREEYENLK